ncbi:hypothetical protein ACFXPY_15725 [Streptomyces sp. NPDC059153]|uniref:hypothetical protein n=1 Tax=unclassified Streptomyces TaxID=2593676 RepID=UPI003695E944
MNSPSVGVCAAHTRIATRSARRGSLIGTLDKAQTRAVLCPVRAAAEAPAAGALAT